MTAFYSVLSGSPCFDTIGQSREHLSTARVREHISLVLLSIVMQKVLSLL